MERSPYEIECWRCGTTKLEMLTEPEANGIEDRMALVYGNCGQCGKTTGWVKAKGRRRQQKKVKLAALCQAARN